MAAIRTRGLTKLYGDVVAVESLDMEVQMGEVFGFLGPNGAGKTTAIETVLDYRRPSSGDVEVLGGPAGDHTTRERVGVLPEDYGVYPRLTAREHVEFVADSKDADVDVDGLLDRVGLTDAVDRRAGGFSKGMKKRLVLSTALVGEPDLLVLDEPTSGLDPNGARRVREIVNEENDRGATVFFSSHVLGQVEAVCDRVGIMYEGRMEAVDTIEGLRRGVNSLSVLHVRLSDADDGRGDTEARRGGLADRLTEIDGVHEATVSDQEVVVRCSDGGSKLLALDLVRETADVDDFATEERSLDDLFAEYTQGDRR